jgi:hypothetical protein
LHHARELPVTLHDQRHGLGRQWFAEKTKTVDQCVQLPAVFEG